MKTPRELLWERHQDAAARLDAVRRGVVGGIVPANVRQPCKAGFAVRTLFITVWQELIWPSRRAWATLAILWSGVLVWNVAENGTFPRSEGTRTRAESHMVQNLAAQRHLLAELLEPAPQKPPEPARPKTRPRTDIIPAFKFC